MSSYNRRDFVADREEVITEEQAFEQGREGFAEGRERTAEGNPFLKEFEFAAYHAWFSGWDDAASDARKA